MVDGGREGHRGEMADAGDRQSVDTGLRAGAAIGRGGGADIFGRRFCSEVLASEVLAICSWLASTRPQPRVPKRKRHTSVVTTVTPEITRHSPRNGFTAYFVLSPVTRLV